MLCISGLILIVGIGLILAGLIKLLWDISVYVYKVLMRAFRNILPKPGPGSSSDQPSGSNPKGPQGSNNSGCGFEGGNGRRRKRSKVVDKRWDDTAEEDATLDPSYVINSKDGEHYRNIYNKLDPDNIHKAMKDIDFTNAEHTVLHRAFKDSIQPDMTQEEYLNCKATFIAKILAARRASPLE